MAVWERLQKLKRIILSNFFVIAMSLQIFFLFAQESLLFAHGVEAEYEDDITVPKSIIEEIYNRQMIHIDSQKKQNAMSLGIKNRQIDLMQLQNDYFATDFSQVKFMNFVSVHFSSLVAEDFARFDYFLSFSVGYGILQKSITTFDENNINIRDSVTLQWLPVDVNLQMMPQTYAKAILRPYLNWGFGTHWLMQEGKLDGFNQGFLLHCYNLGIGLEMGIFKFPINISLAIEKGIGRDYYSKTAEIGTVLHV